MGTIDKQILLEQYLAYLLKGNRADCSSIAHEYLAQNPSIEDLYEEIFKEALYEVGRLWENNKITVASEHMATAITEGILNELFEQIITVKKFHKKVVVACVENEQHQVGIKMVADIFEKNGWDSYFLGTGIPTSELLKFIHEKEPDLLAISLSIYFNFNLLMKMLENIKAEFPNLQIILGGQAINQLKGEALSRLENTIILSDLYVLEKYIKTINNND
ncbi:MAG: B12-binding domain-containing protein [Prolixibacteraceae bacterium]